MNRKDEYQYVKLVEDRSGRIIRKIYDSRGKLIETENPDISPFTKMFQRRIR